jgi:NitT/TauT family transport system ATP-binding protein
VARIVARDVRLAYPRGDGGTVAALDGMSLDVGDNEFVALVGPSGCGKSTFLYIVAGFIRATSGAVLVDDRPVAAPGPDRGMLFQHYALFPWRTVLGNVVYGLEERGLARAECRERARAFIDLVKLGGFEDVYPNRLSGAGRAPRDLEPPQEDRPLRHPRRAGGRHDRRARGRDDGCTRPYPRHPRRQGRA